MNFPSLKVNRNVSFSKVNRNFMDGFTCGVPKEPQLFIREEDSLGDGDEKKNRSFAFNHDRNEDDAHPLPSGCKGCFSLSTGMSVL